jgi:hypothetical protein
MQSLSGHAVIIEIVILGADTNFNYGSAYGSAYSDTPVGGGGAYSLLLLLPADTEVPERLDAEVPPQ